MAAALARGWLMLLAEVHRPVDGLYNSAVAVQVSVPFELFTWMIPPAANTSPEGSSVAVCCPRAVAIPPVGVHLPAVTSYSSALVSLLFEASTPPATST